MNSFIIIIYYASIYSCFPSRVYCSILLSLAIERRFMSPALLPVVDVEHVGTFHALSST